MNILLLSVSQLQRNTNPLRLIFCNLYLQLHIFYTSSPSPCPRFSTLGFFFHPLPPPQVLHCSFCPLPSFSYSKAPELCQKAGQKGHPAQHPGSGANFWCSLQASQISVSANEVLGKQAALPPHWADSGSIKISLKALAVSLETGDKGNTRASVGRDLRLEASSVALCTGLMKSFQLSNCWQRRGKTPGERAKACAERSPRPSQPPAGPPICKPCQPLAHTAFRSRSEHAQLLAHEQLRPRPQTPTGPCFSPAVFVGPGWGLSAPASPSAMEQLGKRSGPAARLDTILRHLSPRLGAAPALVSFPMRSGKGGSWDVDPIAALLPHPSQLCPALPAPCVPVCQGGGLEAYPLGKDTDNVTVLCLVYGVVMCREAVPHAASR